jgi:hypothetical protein
MHGRIDRGAIAALAAGTIAIGAPAAVVIADPSGDHARSRESSTAHVLLISVDGLHQSDLEWYVSNHPSSELAKLVGGGAEYARAQTPIPSDSFPGMTAQVTGGNPRTTGVYYDDEYSHAVLPAGTTSCHGQPNDCGDSPVHSDSVFGAAEAEDAVERTGEPACPAVNFRDDAVGRIGLEHHQQNPSDDDQHDDAGDELNDARQQARTPSERPHAGPFTPTQPA